MVWQLFVSTFAQFICSFVAVYLYNSYRLDAQCTYSRNDYVSNVLTVLDFCWCVPTFT